MGSPATASAARDTLSALCAVAAPRAKMPGYSGEVMPQEAWEYLSNNEGALLIDVRTAPEWQFVGTPNLAEAKSKLRTISWKIYPSFTLNPQFLDQLKAEGALSGTPLFFLCRSGGRSLDAALFCSAQGFRTCFNITDGFEGDPDGQRHRGTSSGWKASGLPWMQG